MRDEWETSSVFNKNLKNFDPISNWVIEVEPEILKKQFRKEQDLKNGIDMGEQISRYSFKCDVPSPRNKFYGEDLNSLQPETEIKSMSEYSETFASRDGKKSEENINTSHNNVYNAIALSQCTSETNKTNSLYPTEKNMKKLKLNETNNDNTNNMTITESNIQLPVIIVPPKEAVAHLSIGSDIDLPIIFEKPTTEKINVISQFILKPKEPNSVTLNAETNFRKQNVPFQMPLPEFPSTEVDENLEITPDFAVSTIGEDPYAFASYENQKSNNISNGSDESKNKNIEYFLDDTNEDSDASEVSINLFLN